MTAEEFRAAVKPRKYRNKPVVVDGVRIDSRREARRWTELQIMERAGMIRDLQPQVTYILAPSVKIAGEGRARPAMRYTADFRYVDAKTGDVVVEDVKNPTTAKAADWRMRQHLMMSVHGISVRVIL